MPESAAFAVSVVAALPSGVELPVARTMLRRADSGLLPASERELSIRSRGRQVHLDDSRASAVDKVAAQVRIRGEDRSDESLPHSVA